MLDSRFPRILAHALQTMVSKTPKFVKSVMCCYWLCGSSASCDHSMTLNTGIRIVGLDEACVSMPVVAYISRAQLDTAVLQPQLDAALLQKIA